MSVPATSLCPHTAVFVLLTATDLFVDSDFGFGGYMSLQISMKNFTSIYSLKPVYLKSFYRSIGTAPYVEDAVFRGVADSPQLPGGHGLVELSKVVFDYQALKINHHARLSGQQTGGLCSSCFWIHDSGGQFATTLKIMDETKDHETSAIVEWDDIGLTLFLNNGHPAFTFTTVETSDGSNCETRPETSGDTWNACPQSWKIRPLLIYSADRGAITVKDNTPGHHSGTLTVPYSPLPLPHGSQLSDYCPAGKQTPNGYRMLVRDGAQLTITVSGNATDEDWKDVFVVDYSQPTWPTAKKSSITMTVTGAGASADGLAGGPYTISSDHSRSWVGPFGGFISASGAWWHAMDADQKTTAWKALPSFLDVAQYETNRASMIRSKTLWKSS